ncbi:MAG: (2Fe-2S)-binding protein [Candidatus Caldarchaeum sp.]
MYVNGRLVTADVEPRRLLVHFIRDDLKLKGTHIGCDTGHCGACTVLINGRAVKSCMLLAVQANNSEILTIDGLSSDGKLHPLQQAFRESFAIQCGYCTPGMIMASYYLLSQNPNPSEAEIRQALSGNLCMCTGYGKIIEAVQRAASMMRR